jgi:hypothetical protein
MMKKATNCLTLPQVADLMQKQAVKAHMGTVHRMLGRGLHLVYVRKDGACRLSLGRVAPVAPSAEELAVVAQSFAVPEGTEPALREAKWFDPVNEKQVVFNVFDLKWREVRNAERG